MNIKYICSLTLVLALVWACDEPITIDTATAEEQVIIEGMVTNTAGRNFVKVTKSRSFYETGSTERITNAIVTVSDETGNYADFVHNPSGEPETEGYYYAAGDFIGAIGRTYSLRVELGENVYEAQDELLPVTPIDSLAQQLTDDEDAIEVRGPGPVYEVLFYAKEPQDRQDQYLFKFYRNDSLIKDSPSDVYFADDNLLGETIDDIELAGYYIPGDLVRAEMYSLTREAFIFYNDLNNLINSDGGMFSPPPANPRTNLSNGAMGFFQASAVATKEITIVNED
ncbi:DUF4249 domain-containing protein [Roseivirga pacifica]|uniref:DUF4249 domain-containing protein n=1 Tax=Roseivirga pacifica TaxID=1267423 RepID=UPI0020956616|nr:DUF4249 domain-containing protein [Roseivirga pacifica]